MNTAQSCLGQMSLLPFTDEFFRIWRIAMKSQQEFGKMPRDGIPGFSRRCWQVLAFDHGTEGDQSVSKRLVANRFSGIRGIPASLKIKHRAGRERIPAPFLTGFITNAFRLTIRHLRDLVRTHIPACSLDCSNVKHYEQGVRSQFTDHVGAMWSSFGKNFRQPLENGPGGNDWR